MRTLSSEERAVRRGWRSEFAPVDLIADCCTWGMFVNSVKVSNDSVGPSDLYTKEQQR
jgi:hypothetical protein